MTTRTAIAPLALCGFLLVTAVRASATPLTIDHVDSVGNQWASVVELINISWDQLSSVCAQDGVTACTGNIGVVETTGWTWATRDQVRTLFYDFGVPAGTLDDYSHFEPASAWAPAVTTAFSPTTSIAPFRQVIGWSASLAGPGVGWTPYVLDNHNPASSDNADLNPQGLSGDQGPLRGAWLFQPATPIPEPSTLLLVASGLLGLRVARRRR